MYVMLEAPLLWYHELSSKLKGIGFKFNPYDSCVLSRMVGVKQQTERYHVDDILLSHVDNR